MGDIIVVKGNMFVFGRALCDYSIALYSDRMERACIIQRQLFVYCDQIIKMRFGVEVSLNVFMIKAILMLLEFYSYDAVTKPNH